MTAIHCLLVLRLAHTSELQVKRSMNFFPVNGQNSLNDGQSMLYLPNIAWFNIMLIYPGSYHNFTRFD